MKNNADYIKGLFTGLALSAALVIFAVFAWKYLYRIPYPNPTYGSSSTTSPENLDELTVRVENLENDQAYNLRNFEWQIDQKVLVLGWAALAISVIAGVAGVRTYNELDKVIRGKVDATLQKELYQRDVLNRQIWLYSDKETETEMDTVAIRLELSGLTYVTPIETLDKKSYKGITIVPIFNEAMESHFVEYLERNKKKLSDRKAAFILYSKSYRVKDDTFEKFANMAPANMPVTVVSHILTVARGIIDDRIENKKEESK